MATDSTRRLHHAIPPWIASDAIFHVRIRVDRVWSGSHSLTKSPIARALLDTVTHYHRQGSWYCHLFLLMPDHTHALLSFPPDAPMSCVIGAWKSWHARRNAVAWQDNYFDHRIRNDREFQLKSAYIRENPVAKGLCEHAADWPWIVDADAFAAPSGTPAPT